MPTIAVEAVPLVRKNPPLRGDISLHPAMPVRGGRGVMLSQHRDVEGEAVDQLQLKRAGFEHIGAVAAEAAPATVPRCRDSRRFRRAARAVARNVARSAPSFVDLPVGAGDPEHSGHWGLGFGPSSSNVADDLGAGLAGRAARRDAARDRCAELPGDSTSAGISRQSACCRVAERNLGGDRIAHPGIVVPGEDFCARRPASAMGGGRGPDRARPRTADAATRQKLSTTIIGRLPQLQGRQPGDRQDQRDDPESGSRFLDSSQPICSK